MSVAQMVQTVARGRDCRRLRSNARRRPSSIRWLRVVLHDRSIPFAKSAPPGDRRVSDRVPFPAEITMVWNHDTATVVRYTTLDASDGGYRIHSTLPMIEGATGVALRLLPEGRPLDSPVMVAWCAPAEGGGYEIGLRAF